MGYDAAGRLPYAEALVTQLRFLKLDQQRLDALRRRDG